MSIENGVSTIRENGAETEPKREIPSLDEGEYVQRSGKGEIVCTNGVGNGFVKVWVPGQFHNTSLYEAFAGDGYKIKETADGFEANMPERVFDEYAVQVADQ